MNFNKHWDIKNKHAFLSPSNYHWVNYSNEKMIETYLNSKAKERGTQLHDLAKQLIELNVRLPRTASTLNMYVNDAIGYGMIPEQPLYYSPNCFGTADAILFKNNFLRIHDLKTGETQASMLQLYIYAALFCLEYNYRPQDIKIELRIYQSNQVFVEDNDTVNRDLICEIVDKIIEFDKDISNVGIPE